MTESKPLAKTDKSAAAIMERVLMTGDLAQLTHDERVLYYTQTCHSLGLNPLTRPFDYLTLEGKLQLYARKECTDQLRTIHEISITKLERDLTEGIYTVTAYARNKHGREDSDMGSVVIEGLRGAFKANATMKAVTKAKRRVTLSICGLGGMIDESEIDDLMDAKVERAMGDRGSEIDEERKALKASIETSLRKRNATKADAKVLFRAYLGAEVPAWETVDLAALKDFSEKLQKEVGEPGVA